MASSTVKLGAVEGGVPGAGQLFGPGRLPGRKGEQAAGGWGFGVAAGGGAQLAGAGEAAGDSFAEPAGAGGGGQAAVGWGLGGFAEFAEPVPGPGSSCVVACSRMRRA